MAPSAVVTARFHVDPAQERKESSNERKPPIARRTERPPMLRSRQMYKAIPRTSHPHPRAHRGAEAPKFIACGGANAGLATGLA